MRGPFRDVTVRNSLFKGLCWLPWITTAALLTIPAVAQKHDKSPSSDAGSAPQPSFRIAIDPLGYQPSSTFYLTGRRSSSSLDFIDKDHLLLTFRITGLLKRLPECSPQDEDQVIRALVIALPDGKVLRSTEWRMHDRGRYLWPLRDGRFLVRQRDSLMITDSSLDLHPFIQSPSPIELVELSPDAKLLLIENHVEWRPQTQREPLGTIAGQDWFAPVHEDVALTILRLDDRTVIARSQARNPVNLPFFDNGYLETLSGRKDHWIVRFVPFHGEPSTMAEVASACEPSENPLTKEVLMVNTCPKGSSDHVAAATSRDGRLLWQYRWNGRAIWPTTTASADGSRVAFSTLQVAHTVGVLDPIGDEDISGQRIEVLDAESGRQSLVEYARPVQSAGQNYALSPDGAQFAVVRDHAVEVYALPPIATVAKAVK